MTSLRLSTHVRLQVGLVALLFVASLAALFFNVLSTLALPERELRIRSELTRASAEMATAAARLADENSDPSARQEFDARLRQITASALLPFEGAEGGFYLADEDVFHGYAFPTEDPRPPRQPHRSDPPPLEEPYIRDQSRQALSLSGDDTLASVRDVGPSRVLVVTRPVGERRPAPMAVWTMVRLTGPAQLENQVNRYRLSIFLALTGIVLALVLMIRLAKIAEKQRLQAQRLADDLRRSEHLAALGKLLAGVAHEVRNPLAGIRSTVQLWQRLGESARDSDSMQAVIQSVDRLNDIVSRLLLFARSDSGDRQPVELNQVLGEVVSLCQAMAKERHVELTLKLDRGNPRAIAFAGALHQVFLNLIANALEAVPRGGRIEVEERLDAARKNIEIRFIDNGPGISPADRDHLFEPFFTTRSAGTGLGLAICREIVVQHGGQIRLESGPGPGATFLVTLPLAP
jgi:signal transduction histidine kinase